jgi:hypothetical protein
VFIGAGAVSPAFYADGVRPLVYDRLNRWWLGLAAPRGRTLPVAPEERGGRFAGTRAA